ncbi:hypothetical protein IW261DRAFT_1522256 [Armillaria novae-zelandiae]|uniref:Glucose-methanol-choline oxidoreductase N-terminal domain-containing protein n=1 Tax=Armillaria novae-zelandiae TaxID=153914 RepID=A0AA39TX56_9AGAR|nr:hypothetical protein IW261DRAFT_1522256 [Armillaria novae-zelandiae]
MDSSLILERSGIGAASILVKFGIKQVVDLPGGGKEYNDHANTVTTEAISSKHPELWDQLSRQCDMDGSRLMGGNGVDAVIKICPWEDEYWKELCRQTG